MKFGSKSHIALSIILWVLALAACSRVAGPAVVSVIGGDAQDKIRVNAGKYYSEPAPVQDDIDAAAASLDDHLRVAVHDTEGSITSVALVGYDGSIGNLNSSSGADIYFPMIDDAFAETAIKGDKGDVINFLTRKESEEIITFYQKVLSDGGWSFLSGVNRDSPATTVRFINESGQLLRLTILGEESIGVGATMVIIESTH